MNYDLSGVASSRESTLLNSNGRTIQSPSLEAKTASRTPLLISSEYGHLEIVKLLQSRFGANVDARDTLERTAFHLSCCCRDPDVSRFIIQLRPELREAVDRHGRTGLFYAVLNNVNGNDSRAGLQRAECGAPGQLTFGDSKFHDYRARLMTLLQTIQQNGLEHMYHVKRPDLFSGSWMEGISGTDDLFAEEGELLRTSCNVSEALIRVCNLLSPPASMPAPNSAVTSEDLLERYLVVNSDDVSGGKGRGSANSDKCGRIYVSSHTRHLLKGEKGNRERESMQIVEKERDDKLLELMRQIKAADEKLGTAVSVAEYTALQEEAAELRGLKTQLEIQLMDLRGQASFAAEKARTMTDELEKRCRENGELAVQLAAAQAMIDNMAVDAARKQTVQEGCRTMAWDSVEDTGRYDRLERQLVVMKGEKGNLLRQNEVLEAEVKRMVTIAGDEKRAEVDRVEQENGKLRQRLGELEEKLERLDKDKSEEMTTEEPSESERKKGEAEREMKTKDRAEKWLSYLDDRDPSIADNAITSRIAVEVPAVAALLNLV
ncbi:tropomyosin beta chain, putative [Perkinsus marinus ATCC 50983]|uniref:Tropomyosin beta chain, putative n=1 Tax=Perkinsus marinus (strain ATCC 50983 / TXsc) TaxID=423536 RepID=C5KXM2_PERM5|nr:tropomyosin beta chain, putative [Perkinsus marinus ATCC 50983]EER10746.1 tropomyosin beta chain, putative [Perkinsus marinus ATCC 50983]|eukprot:XP_002778951.1 tropomyosin beta chain, putative [Perkinsus marinus ATCC 50983]